MTVTDASMPHTRRAPAGVRASIARALALASLAFAPPALAADAPDVPSPPVDDASAILARIQETHRGIAALHVRFEQRTTYATLGSSSGEPAVGEAWFAKPDRMRWSYERPEVQTLVSDGSTLWFHQPERGQVVISAIDPGLAQSVPTAFLSGTGDLDRYRASVVDERGDDVEVELVPVGEAPFRKLRVTADRVRGLVTRLDIVDAFGNENDIRFVEVEPLEHVDESLFTFTPPEGTRIVRPPSRPRLDRGVERPAPDPEDGTEHGVGAAAPLPEGNDPERTTPPADD